MKKKQAEEKARKDKEKEEKARIDPKTMFLGMTEQYSKFDEKVALWHCNDRSGIPTHDAKGEEISKSAMKKIMKLYQAQEKLHNAWLEKNKQN